jgi:3-oxoacyl-[acyl-carrier-protein] synthase-1
MPAGVNTRDVDPALGVEYLLENRRAPLRHVLSNSFGFGGSNCSLIFGRAA